VNRKDSLRYDGTTNSERAREARRINALRPGRQRKSGLSIIILTKDKPELIAPLVSQLECEQKHLSEKGLACEVLIGDTGSTDGKVLSLYRQLAGHETTRVVEGLKYNFSSCNNELAFQYAQYDTFLFMNNDVILPEVGGVLQQIYGLRTSSPPGLGCLGAFLNFPDGRVQHAGMDFCRDDERLGLPFIIHWKDRADRMDFQTVFEVPAVSGAFLMVGASVFQAVGGFHEDYEQECQDVELCLAVRRLGLRNYVVNVDKIIHIENASHAKGFENQRDRRRFLRRWQGYLEQQALL
jgi:GT2 family glycosyltransferase